MEKLGFDFFRRPCLTVARELVGKVLVCGEARLRIVETESYCGEADTACHAHKGRTKRTEAMYGRAGTAYIYLCYGIHWMLNVVTGEEGQPEAVMIRACAGADGPGKLTKCLGIDGRFKGYDLTAGEELWIGDDGTVLETQTAKRVGIGYAAQEDQDRLWRFVGKHI